MSSSSSSTALTSSRRPRPAGDSLAPPIVRQPASQSPHGAAVPRAVLWHHNPVYTILQSILKRCSI